MNKTALKINKCFVWLFIFFTLIITIFLGLQYINNSKISINNKANYYKKKGFDLLGDDLLDEALSSFNVALKYNPNSYEIYYGKGKVFFKKNQLEKSMYFYEKSLEINPNHAPSIDGIGAIYHFNKNYAKAIEYFKKAVEIDPNYSGSYDNLGFAYFYLNDYKKSMMYFNKSISLEPRFADSYFGRGKIFQELGSDKKALKDFNRAIILDSNFFEAYFARGLIFADSLEFENALHDLNKAAEINSNYSSLFFERAEVYYWMGEFEKSLNDLEQADLIGSRVMVKDSSYIDFSSDIHILKGLLLNKLQLKEEAKEEIQKGLTLINHQKEMTSLYRLGYGNLLIEDYEKALDFFNNELDTNKHKFYGRALAYYYLNRKQEAILDLKKAVMILPDCWERNEAEDLLNIITAQQQKY